MYRKKRKLKQIGSEERVKMAAPRGRGPGKAKVKGGIKAQYKVTYANQTHHHDPACQHNDYGFGRHFTTYNMPRLKDVHVSIAPDAARKLKYWLDVAEGEFAGMAVCGNIKDPLRITDFVLLDQRTGGTHADLDDKAINRYFYTMAKAGLHPVQFGRMWFHTHPFGTCGTPSPSGGDDATFAKAFGTCQWSVMLIFNSSGNCYAELQYPEAPVTNYLLDVKYEPNITEAEAKEWKALFNNHVKKADRQADTVAGKKVKVRRKKAKVVKVKSGTDKINDALDALDRRVRDNMQLRSKKDRDAEYRRGLYGYSHRADKAEEDIDRLDEDYERALEIDEREHNAAVARIMGRVY